MNNLLTVLRLFLFSFLILFCTKIYANNVFIGTISAIPENIQQKIIGHSWHEGCPVKLSELAYLKISYWGYDNKPHVGVLIINKILAKETVNIFKKLYDIKYPIQEMKIYDTYGFGDYGKHNDTVGFYCRPPANGTAKYSEHAYGIAIDINPLVNPYVAKSKNIIWPAQSKNYTDRNQFKKGMIHSGDEVFDIFANHGWEWGGLWKNDQDYMHFQKFIAGHYLVEKMKYIAPGNILLEPAASGCN